MSVVKIGFAAPFTGDQASVGKPMSQCAQLAVDHANEWGLFPFMLALEALNDEASPAKARKVARQFVEDDAVMGVVGHKNSGPSAAAAPIYDAAGLAQLAPSSTNPQLSQQGYQTFFRLCASDTVQGQVAAQYAVRVLGAQHVVIIHDKTDYGQPLAEVVRETVEAEKARVDLFAGIDEGQTDFSQTVARIKDLGPDLVYFALTEIESSILTKQLKAAGVEAMLFGTDGSKESQFLPLAGEAAEGVYQTYAGVDPASTLSAQPFVEAYEAKYGPVPVYGAEVYDAANLLIHALQAAGTDRAAVLDKIRHIEAYQGITGPIQFDPNGDRYPPQVSLWRVENGEMHMLGLARDLIGASKA